MTGASNMYATFVTHGGCKQYVGKALTQLKQSTDTKMIRWAWQSKDWSGSGRHYTMRNEANEQNKFLAVYRHNAAALHNSV
jgi:hypothetical protein